MTDYLGTAPLPAVSRGPEPSDPTETSPAFTDPGLKALCDFCAAIIRAEIASAFSTDFPVEAVCRKAYPHDPTESYLETNYLPALFLWRSSSMPRHYEDGLDGAATQFTGMWVFAPGSEDEISRMLPVLQGISAALGKAITLNGGRHQGWVVSGDADPFAATYGSSILDHAGFWTLNVGQPFRFAQVQLDRTTFPAIQFELEARENYTPGTQDGLGSTISADMQNTFAPAFVQQVVTVASDFTSDFTEDFH